VSRISIAIIVPLAKHRTLAVVFLKWNRCTKYGEWEATGGVAQEVADAE